MAKDFFHEAVKAALILDGWTITHDPYQIKAEKGDYFIDLGAEKLLAAEKKDQKIAVEIKSFLEDSLTHAFHTAVGQFLNYRVALAEKEPDRVLFLAVPEDVFIEFFDYHLIKLSLEAYHIHLVVFNPLTKTIVSWTKK